MLVSVHWILGNERLDAQFYFATSRLYPNNLKTNSSYLNILLNSNKREVTWETGGFEALGLSAGKKKKGSNALLLI